jgi:hypothetical protein
MGSPKFALCLLLLATEGVPHSATVRNTSPNGFWNTGLSPDANSWEAGTGSFELVAREGGKDTHLTVTFRRGATPWRIELKASEATFDVELVSRVGRVNAALAVSGTGSVYRTGRLVSDKARIRAAGLTTGIHADDGTFAVLANARPGDLEGFVLAEGLPNNQELKGFLLIGFNDVSITLDGKDVSSQRRIPNSAPGVTAVGGSSTVVTAPPSSPSVNAALGRPAEPFVPGAP